MAAERRKPVVVVIVVTSVVVVALAAVAAIVVLRGPASAMINTVADGGNHVVRSPSTSMEPAIRKGDLVAVSTRTPFDLRPGVVVVVRTPSPEGGESKVLKRVVAVGPATVAFDDGRVLVNGSPIDEPYLPAGTRTTQGAMLCTPEQPCGVPAGSLYLLGDNRPHSRDSRYVGSQPVAQVDGVALAIAGPADRVGPIPGAPSR